jgi:hypothetical protein
LASSSEQAQIAFVRSGGMFAGNRLELEVDEQQLSAEEAAALEQASGAGAVEREPVSPATRGMPADEYQYDLTIRRGDEEWTLRFTDSTLPPELAPLVRLLEQRAEGEVRRRAGR